MFGSFSLIVNLKTAFLTEKLLTIFTIFHWRFTLTLLANYLYVAFWIIVVLKLSLIYYLRFFSLFIICTRLFFLFRKLSSHMQSAAINTISLLATFAIEIYQALSLLISILITLYTEGYFVHRLFSFAWCLTSLGLSLLIWDIF